MIKNVLSKMLYNSIRGDGIRTNGLNGLIIEDNAHKLFIRTVSKQSTGIIYDGSHGLCLI